MSVQLLQKKFLPDNKSESSEKVPDKICVEMTPKTNAAWSFVQELATNPRVRMLLKGDRKLSSVMNYMSSKWKPHRVKLVSSLCHCLVIEILTCGWYEILIGIIWGGGIKIWEIDCISCLFLHCRDSKGRAPYYQIYTIYTKYDNNRFPWLASEREFGWGEWHEHCIDGVSPPWLWGYTRVTSFNQGD